MLARLVVGLGVLLAALALGAGVARMRGSGQPGLRAAARKVHWAIGVVAVAFLVVFAITAARLVLG